LPGMVRVKPCSPGLKELRGPKAALSPGSYTIAMASQLANAVARKGCRSGVW